MNKISAHQRLIRLNWFIFFHDTDPILRQKITLRFACRWGFKASTLQPEKPQIVTKQPTYVVMAQRYPPLVTSFLSRKLAINCHANSAGNRMNIFDILLKNRNSFLWNGQCAHAVLSPSYIR
jgi:hypothetical protein